jgi:ribosome-binding protein aMBF1 (putative translation factor)
MKTARAKKTSDALQILGRNDDLKLRAAIEEQLVRSKVAEMVLEARERKHLTQAELAKLMGTRQSVISRIEDADDAGSVTVATLTRLFAALDMNLSFRAVPARA